MTISRYRLGFVRGSLAVAAALLVAGAGAAEYKAGMGRMDITPDWQSEPVYLSGYAARTVPATGMLHRVWAKALALEDSSGKRVVVVTADMLGFTREIIDVVARQVEEKHGLGRESLFFNASHTHSGPIIWPVVIGAELKERENLQRLLKQNQTLTASVTAAIEQALTSMEPAQLSFGIGSCGFAINRRKLEVAPVDHSVPLLRITSPEGKLRGVVVSYACHNTTLTGGNLMVNGDYAGFAMLELEEEHPGCTAFFIQGCGGDMGPEPRGTVEYARKYGSELAESARAILQEPMRSVTGNFATRFREVELEFEPVEIGQFQRELFDQNRFIAARAALMLECHNLGHPVRTMPYPMQLLRIGKSVSVLFLSGESVIDYALRTKREFPDESVVVAGYSSEVQCYIPSRRILQEGGYEADSSMIYYMKPGRFAPSVEERIFAGIRELFAAR